MQHRFIAAVGLVGLLAGTYAIAEPGGAADHLEAPLVRADGRTDINDVYAFRNGANTVLVMTVNPAAGLLSPTTLDPNGVYRFQIDNDGDVKKDRTIEVKAAPADGAGRQDVMIKGVGGKGQTRGRTGQTIALPGGGQAMVGTFDDPFFFDLEAFLGVVKGQGAREFCDAGTRDFFAGLDVSAIVVEVPSAKLTGDGAVINVWAETESNGDRIDRMGKPAIATVLIDDGHEDAFNQDRPHNDAANWAPEVSKNLQFLSGLDGDGYDAATADAIAGVLVPDVLTLDTSSDAGFVPGLNGRRLADDVIDFELAVVTGLLDAGGNGPVLDSDCVDANDVPFPGAFPYLAPANP